MHARSAIQREDGSVAVHCITGLHNMMVQMLVVNINCCVYELKSHEALLSDLLTFPRPRTETACTIQVAL
jgi:hypothetical protein